MTDPRDERTQRIIEHEHRWDEQADRDDDAHV
jgi:hypothetical protein